MAIINIGNKTVIPISSSILPAGGFNIDAMYQTEYISDLWSIYPISGDTKKVIQEGQQVYITNGSQWIVPHSVLGDYIYPEILPEGYEIIKPEGKNFDIIRSKSHKGEIWVLTNLNNFKNPIYDFDVATLQEKSILSPQSGWKRLAYVDDLSEYIKKEDISYVYKYKGSVPTENDLPTTGVQVGDVYNVESTGDNYAWTGESWDKLGGCLLPKGNESNPHLIWTSDKGWTASKISINDIELPNNGKENDVLSLNAEGNLIWSSVNQKKELPDYSIEEQSNILVVNENGNLEWSDVLNWEKL